MTTFSQGQIDAIRRQTSVERDFTGFGAAQSESEGGGGSSSSQSSAAGLIASATGSAAPPDVADEGSVGADNGRHAREQHTHGSQDLKRYALLVG